MKINTYYAEGFSIMQFNDEDKFIGRLYQEGGQLKFEGSADEAAHQLFKHCIRENNQYLVMVEEQNNTLHAELLAMEHDRDHWKKNHDHQVECARVIKGRHDLPIDRHLLHDALLALGFQDGEDNRQVENVVTTLPALDLLLDVFEAARKLVKCKGRYHAELNYKALAALFGVTNIPEPKPEQEAAMDELTILTQQMEQNKITLSPEAFDEVQRLIDNPPAPSERLRELMTRPSRLTPVSNDAALGEVIEAMFGAVVEPPKDE
ncbi:DUF1778 domain-containing protein [Salmonella enterica]|nr:DUF1778 domain-containing protein [Salmonella enterica]